MKKYRLLLIGIVTLFFVLISLVVYGVKVSKYKYSFQTIVTYYCVDEDDCYFNDVKDLYKALQKYLFKKDNINSIIDKLNYELDKRLSTEDIESSIKLKKKAGNIELTTIHKDLSVAYRLNQYIMLNSLDEFGKDRKIVLVITDYEFIQKPNIWKHIIYGTSIGIMVSLFLLASGFEFKKTKKVEDEKSSSLSNSVGE